METTGVRSWWQASCNSARKQSNKDLLGSLVRHGQVLTSLSLDFEDLETASAMVHILQIEAQIFLCVNLLFSNILIEAALRPSTETLILIRCRASILKASTCRTCAPNSDTPAAETTMIQKPERKKQQVLKVLLMMLVFSPKRQAKTFETVAKVITATREEQTAASCRTPTCSRSLEPTKRQQHLQAQHKRQARKPANPKVAKIHYTLNINHLGMQNRVKMIVDNERLNLT